MYTELKLYDSQLSELEILDIYFQALDLNINGICVPAYYVPLIHDTLPEGMVLSSQIDYPNGMADASVKNHAILNIARKGANAVDLVVNPHLITNGKLEVLEKDISGHQEICKEQNISLRLMLEYRTYKAEHLSNICGLIDKLGIEYVFPSTGHRLDSCDENVLAGKYMKKKYPKLNVITNGNIWQKTHYVAIVQAELFGVRFNSVHAAKNCFVGV